MAVSPRLECMPVEIIGNIVAHLAYRVGTEGIDNREADLPSALRAFGRLSLTSRALHEKLGSVGTRYFLQALAHKYEKNEIDLALQLNTPPARQWAWIRVLVDHYPYYEKAMAIHRAVLPILREAEESALLDQTHLFPSLERGRETGDYQLSVTASEGALLTPFGSVNLWKTVSVPVDVDVDVDDDDDEYCYPHQIPPSILLPLIQSLINTLEASYVGFSNSAPMPEDAFALALADKTITKIPISELTEYCGKKVAVFVNQQASFYAIPPTLPPLDLKEWDFETKARAWTIYERYSRSIAPTEKEEAVRSRREYPITCAPINLVSWAIQKTQLVAQIGGFRASSAISNTVCALHNLSAQTLECFRMEIEVERKPNVDSDVEDDCYYGHLSTTGGNKKIDAATLLPAYKTVLQKVVLGWESAFLKQHPCIVSRESEEEWQLYVKRKMSRDESTLLDGVLRLTGLCQFAFYSTVCRAGRKISYLWIRKDRSTIVWNALHSTCI